MTSQNRLHHIDTWRAIAVSLVIISHVVNYSSAKILSSQFPWIAWRTTALGHFGVLLFFCISGFVICRGLIHEHESTNQISLKGFYARRILRIVPPLFAYLSTLFILSEIGVINVPTSSLLQAATFLCNFKSFSDCSWYAGHTWSLAYEEQFYLAFPAVFIILSLANNPKYLTGTIAVLTLTANQISEQYALAAEFISIFLYMLWGCLAALYWTPLAKYLDKINPIYWSIAVIITFSLNGLVAIPSNIKFANESILTPILIVFVVFGTPIKNKTISRYFENRKVCHIGKASYSIYLWQQLATAPYPSIPIIATPVFILIMLATSLLSYKYFEKPLIALGARITTRYKSQIITKTARTSK